MRCGRGRCRGRGRYGEGEGGAGVTWLIVIVVNPPALSLTRQGLRSPAGPVVVSLPAGIVIRSLALLLACWRCCCPYVVPASCRVIRAFVVSCTLGVRPTLVVSCRPPCACCSLAGTVIAPQCCCEPAGAIVTRPCCCEPTGAVVTSCHPGLRRVVCAFVVGWCWPPLVLVASCHPSLRSLRRVVRPCACRVVSCRPPRIHCVVRAFVMSSPRSRVMLFPVVVVWTRWRSSPSVMWHLGPVRLVVVSVRSLPCPLIPRGICPFHTEYVLAEISPILVIFFHLYSTWNGVDSMWIPPFHMEFPHEFHPISMWIPCGKMDSRWNPQQPILE